MSDSQAWNDDGWRSSAPTLLGSVANHKLVVALVVLLSIAIGYGASLALPPVYEATTSFLISEGAAVGDAAVDPVRKVQQEASRLASRSVLSRAAEDLGAGIDVETLEDRVEIEVDDAVGSIDVVARAGDPQTAAESANAVRDAYTALTQRDLAERVANLDEALSTQQEELAQQVQELQSQVAANPNDAVLQQQLDTAQAQLQALRARSGEIGVEAALATSGITILERAIPPDEPASPRPVRNAAVAAVLGLALAVGVAYWRAVVAARRRLEPDDVLGAPLLARIPDFRRSGAGEVDPLFDLEAAESYQFLLASVDYATAQTGATSILVTSPSPGDGKSLTALHLARAMAVQGRDVTLVDADIRARGITTLLHADDHPGLVALVEGGEPESAVKRYRISQTVHLQVVPAGRPAHQPTGLFATEPYRRAISRITALSDLTIIDSGPLLTVADASAIATQVSGIVMVLDSRTTEDQLLKLRERLRLLPTPVLGYVINRAGALTKAPYPYLQSQAQPQPGARSGRLRGLFRSGEPPGDEWPVGDQPPPSNGSGDGRARDESRAG